MRISGFGWLAVLVGLGAMVGVIMGAGSALAQTLIIRSPVSGGGAAVSGPQNGEPALAGNPGDQDHQQDTPYSVTLTAADPDDEAVTVTATSLPGWLSASPSLPATLDDDEELTLSGTPVAGAVGDHPVSLAIEDEQGLAGASVDFTITVTPPAATIDLTGVNTLTMAGGNWSGSFTIDPADAELMVGGMAGSLTTDTGVSGSLDDGDAWTADTGGLALSRSGGTITLSGPAEAGQYSLDLTPEYAASATPLTLTALDQSKLTAGDASGNDRFGWSVAFDGDTALIGASHDNAPATDSGSAYVFTRSGGSWTQQDKLTASDAASGDEFGYAVALDGDTALIAARYDDGDGGTSTNSGSAYVFTREGGNWSEQAKLTASDAAAHDYFGYAVVLDGETALIGARGDDGLSGSAYVFTRSDTDWSEQAKLTASDAAADDEFGIAVALDGDTALIGSWEDDGGGSAYITDLTALP